MADHSQYRQGRGDIFLYVVDGVELSKIALE